MMNDRASTSLPGKKENSPAEGQRPLVREKQPSSTVHDHHDLGARRTIRPTPQPAATTTMTAPPRTQKPKVSTTTKPPLPPRTTQVQPKVSTTTKPPLSPWCPVRRPRSELSGHDEGGNHRRAGKGTAVPDRGPVSANQSFPSKCYRRSSSSSSSGGAASRSKTLPPSCLPFKKRLTQMPLPETSIEMREDGRPVKKSDNLIRQEHLAASSKSGAAATVRETPAGVRLSGSSHETSMKRAWGRGMPTLPPPGGGSSGSSSRPFGKKVVRFADHLQDGPDPTFRR